MSARVGGILRRAGLGSFLLLLGCLVVVYAASFYAPPAVEPNGVDFSEAPAEVASDAMHDLQTREYRVEHRVSLYRYGEWETRERDRLVVDNGARRYSSSDPAVQGLAGIGTRGFAEAYVGYSDLRRDGRSEGWERSAGRSYTPTENPFSHTPHDVEAVTVVTENESVLVVRIEGIDTSAWDVATQPPATENVTANLTLAISKPSGQIASATQLSVGEDSHDGSLVRSRGRFEFSNYGSTDIDRPLGTYPPSAEEVAYRLDLGLHTLATGGWRVLLLLAVGVAIAAVLVRRQNVPDRVRARLSGAPRVELVRETVGRWRTDEWVRWCLSAGRTYATLLAAAWLVLLSLTTLAVVVGPAPETGGDELATDRPAAELGVEAIADVETRPHVTELWLSERNRSSGYHRYGIAERVVVDPTTPGRKYESWPGVFEENTTRSDSGVALYATPWASWQEQQDIGWQRMDPPEVSMIRSRELAALDIDASALRVSNTSIVGSNESAVTIAYTDDQSIEAFGFYADENESGRVLVTVATSDDPHLERVTVEWRRNSTVTRQVYRIRDIGPATVERPERVAAPVERVVWRAGRGMQRLASWVGF